MTNKPEQRTEFSRLPEGVRELWKIDPGRVKFVHKSDKNRRSTVQQYVAYTDTHKYTWTFVRGRQQWVVRKSEHKPKESK